MNEEAGKLLLEQYDDYAKRAKLYTTIHAKHGKTEFQKLFSEREPLSQQEKTKSSTPTPTSSSSSSEHQQEGENNKKKEEEKSKSAQQNENPSSSGSSTTITGKQQKEETNSNTNTSITAMTNVSSTPTTTISSNTSNNVLTPSAVGNNVVQANNMKRPATGDVQQEGKDDVETASNKQPRVESLPKKKPAPTADRKKRLRRL